MGVSRVMKAKELGVLGRREERKVVKGGRVETEYMGCSEVSLGVIEKVVLIIA